MNAQTAKTLDKFYTNPDVADECAALLDHYLANQRKLGRDILLVEPSAGNGSFVRPGMLALDIAPEHPSIRQHDFLTSFLDEERQIAFIGNPPFGKKGDLAARFINQALLQGSVVGFIVPVLFRKWAAQQLIHPSAKLVLDHELHSDVFTFMGKPYAVRCCFQIWDRSSIVLRRDKRIGSAPATSHPDFEMWQYNRTTDAERYFDYPWDFAVPRQGYQDYRLRVRNPDECNRRKQWALFKAKNDLVLNRLMSIDFDRLSRLNTSTPGFGKADVVAEYRRRWPNG